MLEIAQACNPIQRMFIGLHTPYVALISAKLLIFSSIRRLLVMGNVSYDLQNLEYFCEVIRYMPYAILRAYGM